MQNKLVVSLLCFMLLPRIWCRGRIHPPRDIWATSFRGFDESNPCLNLETVESLSYGFILYLYLITGQPVFVLTCKPGNRTIRQPFSRDTQCSILNAILFWLLTPDSYFLCEIRISFFVFAFYNI